MIVPGKVVSEVAPVVEAETVVEDVENKVVVGSSVITGRVIIEVEVAVAVSDVDPVVDITTVGLVFTLIVMVSNVVF